MPSDINSSLHDLYQGWRYRGAEGAQAPPPVFAVTP